MKRKGSFAWRRLAAIAGLVCLSCIAGVAPARAGTSLLFVGNSFTFGWGSPVRFYRAATVTDLNGEGTGGVPALFKVFTQQAGLDWDVFLETHPGVGIDWHLANRGSVLTARAWDHVTMAGYSTLDPAAPGNAALLVSSVGALAARLRAGNARVDIRLEATFPRADQVYLPTGHWYGKSVAAMVQDIRSGYDLAAKSSPSITGVLPVGEAWLRAIDAGVADGNPYDGVTAGQTNLWTYDHYHASTAGYYLKALVVFGHFTARDPRSLGEHECAAFELGLSPLQASALQQVAAAQLLASGVSLSPPSAQPTATSAQSRRCPASHE